MNIGRNINLLRRERGMTQAQLAEKLGVSEQAVSKWENELCAPDVSLFPILADFFGVSIDRLFGYSRSGMEAAVQEILKRADDQESPDRAIAVYREGLRRYPGSAELKVSLAFALSQMRRVSGEAERIAAAEAEALRLCREVADTCGDGKRVDEALFLLARLWQARGEPRRAEACLDKISAEDYDFHIIGLVEMLGRQDPRRQLACGEEALWRLSVTMRTVCGLLGNALLAEGKAAEALDFLVAEEKSLSLFDRGCPNFCVAGKFGVSFRKASAYQMLGEKDRCLTELERLFELAEQVRETAKNCADFHVSARNPMYFAHVEGEQLEEWMPDAAPERMLAGFDAFFDDDAAYRQFRERHR